MSSTTDKIKGATNEGIGKMVDSDKMQVEGVVQERKSEAQQAVGKTKETLKKAIDG